jgi:hypothetical protein
MEAAGANEIKDMYPVCDLGSRCEGDKLVDRCAHDAVSSLKIRIIRNNRNLNAESKLSVIFLHTVSSAGSVYVPERVGDGGSAVSS